MTNPTFDDAQRSQAVLATPKYVQVSDDTPKLQASQFTVRVDETNNNLVFVVKYSNGTTVKSGTVALS